MTPRTFATISAITSLSFGVVGLVMPQVLGKAFGVEFDLTAMALARLASAAYVGYAVLAWLARDVTDPVASRAVAGANAVSWALSAVVVATAIASGVGDGRLWIMVGMQVVFAVGWSLAYGRRPVIVARTT